MILFVAWLLVASGLLCFALKYWVKCYNLQTDIEELRDKIQEKEYARQFWYRQAREADRRRERAYSQARETDLKCSALKFELENFRSGQNVASKV